MTENGIHMTNGDKINRDARPRGFTEEFNFEGDASGKTKHHDKRVTFLESDPHGQFRGRPSVPGPSAYETQPTRPSYMDSQFTENISRQMRVPDQIRPYEEDFGDSFNGFRGDTRGNSLHSMNVPDRILVAGHDQHVAVRDQRPRELDFDDMMYGFRGEQSVQVQTPPRTLTVNQHTFPAVNGLDTDLSADGPMIAPYSASALSDSHLEQSLSLQAEKNMTSAGRGPKTSIVLRSGGGLLTPTGPRSGLPDTPGSRLVIDLYKRVEVLERENHYRYLREMVGYAVVLGFVALKGMSFFLKR